MSVASSRSIKQLIESMSYHDKDYRYMAVNDLMAELQNSSMLDNDSEIKISKALLQLLNDVNEEVQNNAVKCLVLLSTRLSEKSFNSVIAILISLITETDKAPHRIVCIIALKNIITTNHGQDNSQCVASIAKDHTVKLVAIMDQRIDDDALQEIIETITELLERYGPQMATYYELLSASFQRVLLHPRQTLRKRAIHALGKLLTISPVQLFHTFLAMLMCESHSETAARSLLSTSSEMVITRLQCFAVLSQRPSELGEQILTVLPVVLNWRDHENDEIREAMLQVLEVYILNCGPALQPMIADLLSLFCQLLQYDPNYSALCVEEQSEQMDSTSAECGDDVDSDSYSNLDEEDDEEEIDDDESWKVRRSAAKCLQACLTAFNQDLLPAFYLQVAPTLLQRIFEREETVLREIFHLIRGLCDSSRLALEHWYGMTFLQCGPASQFQPANQMLASSLSVQSTANHSSTINYRDIVANQPAAVNLCGQSSIQHDFYTFCVALIGKVCQLSGLVSRVASSANSSRRVRIIREVVKVLRKLVHSLPLLRSGESDLAFQAVLAPHLTQLFTLTANILSVKGGDFEFDCNMRHEAMAFLSLLFQRYNQSAVWKDAGLVLPLVDLVRQNIGVSFLRISSEALNLLQILAPRIAALQIRGEVGSLFDQAFSEMQAADRDFELKEQSIAAVTTLVIHNAEDLEDKIPAFLVSLCAKVDNEVTRSQAMKTFMELIECGAAVDLSSIYIPMSHKILQLFRQNDRSIRLAALKVMEALWRFKSSQLDVQLCQAVLTSVPNTVQENDAQILQTALLLTGHCLSRAGSLQAVLDEECQNAVRHRLLSVVLQFLHSGHMHDVSLSALLFLLGVIAAQPVERALVSKDRLVEVLIRPIKQNEALSSQPETLYGIACCIAEVQVHQPLEVRDQFLAQIIADVQSSIDQSSLNTAQLSRLQISILTLGQLGSQLIDQPDQQRRLVQTLFQLLVSLGAGNADSQSASSSSLQSSAATNPSVAAVEELRRTVSLALGRLGARTMPVYVPILIHSCQTTTTTTSNPNQPISVDTVYFYLHSLKEALLQPLDPHQTEVEDLWRFLAAQIPLVSSASRHLVGECLGRVVLLQPVVLLAALVELVKSMDQSRAGELAVLFSAARFSVWSQLSRRALLLQSSSTNQSAEECRKAVDQLDGLLLALVEPAVNWLQSTASCVDVAELGLQKAVLGFLNTLLHLRGALLLRRCLIAQQAVATANQNAAANQSGLEAALAVLPTQILKMTAVRRELIQLVEMGPFKHYQDAGLEIRKCAFECMSSIMEKELDCVQLEQFCECLERGMEDQQELKHSVFLMIIRLANLRPKIILQRMDKILAPLRCILADKGKREPVKQEQEKLQDLKRFAIRVLATISTIPFIEKNAVFVDFIKSQINPSVELRSILEAERKDLLVHRPAALYN